jgi:hypothetical protein
MSLVQWKTFDMGIRAHVSLHDTFWVGWEVKGGFLRSIVERDLKDSKDRRCTSLQKFDIWEFDVYLSASSPDDD